MLRFSSLQVGKCLPYLTAPGSLYPYFQFKEILRKDVIELVLATDMKQVRGLGRGLGFCRLGV